MLTCAFGCTTSSAVSSENVQRIGNRSSRKAQSSLAFSHILCRVLQLACGRRREHCRWSGRHIFKRIASANGNSDYQWLSSGRPSERERAWTPVYCKQVSLARSGVACPQVCTRRLLHSETSQLTCRYTISLVTLLFGQLTTLNWFSLVFKSKLHFFVFTVSTQTNVICIINYLNLYDHLPQAFSTFSFAFSCLCTGNDRLVQTSADKLTVCQFVTV